MNIVTNVGNHMRKIDAYVVEGTNQPFTRQQLYLDDPQPGELLVRIVASGICHTDLNTQTGNMPMPLPAVLGHEGSGVVEAVGEGVEDINVGDHVILGWPYCGKCHNCDRGEHRYCEHIGAELCGGVRQHGLLAGHSAYTRENGKEIGGHFFGQSSFATYSIVTARSVVKAPKNLDLTLLGPLACGITTGAGAVFNNANPGPGETVVIFGAGAVGLAAVMAAATTPASKIIIVDIKDDRLELAKRFGATHTINSNTTNAVETILAINGGPVEHAIDCTGVIKVIEDAAETVGMLGQLLLIGGAPTGARFSLDHLKALWGQRIIGVLGGSSTSRKLIPGLLDLHARGKFPFDQLISFYDFDNFDQALADAKSGKAIKPVIRMSEV